MKKASVPKVRRLSAAKQRRMDELLDKSSEGRISSAEKRILEKLVAEAERLMVYNAKRLAQFTAIEARRGTTVRTPVTVWLHATPTEP
jgi:hypothetical protein